MKKFNTQSFLFGIIFSISLFSFMSFNAPWGFNAQVNKDVVQISETDANTYKTNYSSIFADKSQGFSVSVMQWKAINQLVTELDGNLDYVSGFRFYHGLTTKSTTSDKISMAYALDNNFNLPPSGSHSESSMVIAANKVESVYTDDCPPFCD